MATIKKIAENIFEMLNMNDGETYDFELAEKKHETEIWYFGAYKFKAMDLSRIVVSAYGRGEYDLIFSELNTLEEIEDKLKEKFSTFWKI